MKWLIRILAVLLLVLLALAAYAVATAQRTQHPVGFQLQRATDAGGAPFAVGIWYPTDATPHPTTFLGGVILDVARDAPVTGRELPLVVISHGNGGGPGSHADLALALADAGYVVAAPMHGGDNYIDNHAIGSATLFSGRTRQLHATVDYMLTQWPGRAAIDPRRIGAFGLSAGGFTVLAAIGARPDMARVASHCAETPEFVCAVLRQARSPLLGADARRLAGTLVVDPRIRAAVVAAPGLGFTMTPEALAGVRVPVQLWNGGQDTIVPYASNARLVREGLGARVEFHDVPGASHVSFLTPCGLLRPPGICQDPDGFDRKAFHARMDAAVVAFFDRHLRR